MTNPLHGIRHVFLDRDGVINVKLPYGQYVTQPGQLTFCPGAAEAIAKLNHAGMRVIVVTNQRGVALNLFSEQQLSEVHQHLHQLLAAHGAHLDAIYACPHARDACDCRKPLPGLFLQAFRDFPNASPANSLMIGDSLSDIQAGMHLGLATVFIEGIAETRDPGADHARSLTTYRAASLAAFVQSLIS